MAAEKLFFEAVGGSRCPPSKKPFLVPPKDQTLVDKWGFSAPGDSESPEPRGRHNHCTIGWVIFPALRAPVPRQGSLRTALGRRWRARVSKTCFLCQDLFHDIPSENNENKFSAQNLCLKKLPGPETIGHKIVFLVFPCGSVLRLNPCDG